MPKGVKICLAAVVVIFTVSLTVSYIILKSDKKGRTDDFSESIIIEIMQDNEVLYRLDLAEEENRTFRIETADGGWNDVTIKDGQICVSDANCPDHTCVKNGYLRNEYLPIICLPHKLVIRFCD